MGRPSLQLGLVALAAGLLLAWEPRAAELSEAERAYVAEKGPFTFCVDPDWPPYEIINAQGEHEGISADLLRLAAGEALVPLKLLPTKDWDESLAASKEGRCQILSFLNQSQKRDEWLIFTQPIFVDRNVIVTREEHRFIDDLAAVAGETLVLPRGTSIEERVRRDFPELKIVLADSEAEAFAMVSQKKADMTMRSLIVAVYTIKKDGWFNLKISGQVPSYDNHLRIGVRKDMPMLRAILDKGVAKVTPAQRAEIANRHVSIRVEAGIDYGLILKIVAVFSIILVTSLFWATKLRSLNRKLLRLSQSDELTGIANRRRLMEIGRQETVRARRFRHQMSVLLVDIDHFKSINDTWGHPTGDRAIKALTATAGRTIRDIDTIGRLGGEEFAIVLPQTDAAGALTIADRLRAAVEHDIRVTAENGDAVTFTISIGLATLADGDASFEQVLGRADQALYAAKTGGRNRVCTLPTS